MQQRAGVLRPLGREAIDEASAPRVAPTVQRAQGANSLPSPSSRCRLLERYLGAGSTVIGSCAGYLHAFFCCPSSSAVLFFKGQCAGLASHALSRVTLQKRNTSSVSSSNSSGTAAQQQQLCCLKYCLSLRTSLQFG